MVVLFYTWHVLQLEIAWSQYPHTDGDPYGYIIFSRHAKQTSAAPACWMHYVQYGIVHDFIMHDLLSELIVYPVAHTEQNVPKDRLWLQVKQLGMAWLQDLQDILSPLANRLVPHILQIVKFDKLIGWYCKVQLEHPLMIWSQAKQVLPLDKNLGYMQYRQVVIAEVAEHQPQSGIASEQLIHFPVAVFNTMLLKHIVHLIEILPASYSHFWHPGIIKEQLMQLSAVADKT